MDSTITGKVFSIPMKRREIKTILDEDRDFIIRLYRGSKSKYDQLRILGQLYGRKKTTIAKFLYDNNVVDDTIIKNMR